jgi:hypothetical protein
MKAVLYIILFFLSFSLSSQKKFDIDKKYSPSDLKEDTRLIKTVILTMHPVMGVYKPKSYYAKLFDDFIDHLNDSLTEKEYRLRMKLLFDELQCGHTEVKSSKAYEKALGPMRLNFFPYYMLALEGKAYVVTAVNRKKDSLLSTGTIITSINNIDMDSILHYTSRFYTADATIRSGKEQYLRGGINMYYPSLFGRPDSFLVGYSCDTLKGQCWVKAARLKNLPPIHVGPKEDSTWTSYRRANMLVGKLDENTTVLKIRSFRPMRYKRVYRKTFRRLQKEKTRNLVIDLRNNGGGNLMNSYRLLSYVINKKESVTLKTHIKRYPFKQFTKGNFGFRFTRWILGVVGKSKTNGDTTYFTHTIKPSKKHHFNGNVYVLINGGSFSASCIVSAYLKESGRAKFIGLETAGAREGCNAGVTPYYTLPRTKVQVRVPAFRIVHDINSQLSARGILPDYEVKYSFKDLLKRKDLEMEKLKEIIGQN